MPSYQDITRHDLNEGLQVLHIADEVNHLEWIRQDVTRKEPFQHPCDTCGDLWHEWRRVWVIA
jgi:hypothetical protein